MSPPTRRRRATGVESRTTIRSAHGIQYGASGRLPATPRRESPALVPDRHIRGGHREADSSRELRRLENLHEEGLESQRELDRGHCANGRGVGKRAIVSYLGATRPRNRHQSPLPTPRPALRKKGRNGSHAAHGSEASAAICITHRQH